MKAEPGHPDRAGEASRADHVDDGDPFGWHPDAGILGHRDREALEAMGAEAWAASLDYLFEEAAVRPTKAETYPDLREAFYGEARGPREPPLEPRPWTEVMEDLRELLPHQFNAQHPRAWAYFTPPPLPAAAAAGSIAPWLNQGVDVWACSPTSTFVEEEVVAWLRRLVGFGDGSWGVLTSGGSMANLMALTLARDVGLRALRGLGGPPRGLDLDGVRVYASDQAHFSIQRSISMLGFPSEALRIVPSDERFRLHGEAVAAAVDDDLSRGVLPWCVAAVSGSTNTGSVDLVEELAELCRQHGMWLHVDAAYGGAVRFSPKEGWRVPSLELADTVAIDPHKWFFQPYDIGALMVKKGDDLLTTFHGSPEYYRHTRPEDEPLHWYRYSFEGTRPFRALKLWMSWKHIGSHGFARLIEGNLALAALLARRCRESEDFELCPEEPELSVVCFRHLPGGTAPASTVDPQALDRHQDLLQRALEVSGEGWLSTTRLRGRTFLRAGIVNYLSTEADVDRMLEALRRLARDLPSDT